MLTRARHILIAMITSIVAVAFVTASFGHSISRADLDPDRAYILALSDPGAFCGDEDAPGGQKGTCPACVLAKTFALGVDDFGPVLTAQILVPADIPTPDRTDLPGRYTGQTGPIRAPPLA